MTTTGTALEADYTTGSWVGVAGSALWLLADVPPGEPVVWRCWRLARTGAALDQVLGAILSAGLRSVASFALVRYVDGVAHVVVRGAARVELVGSAGEVLEVGTVRAGDWADRTIDQPLAEIRLVAPSGASGAAVLPLTEGVALAERIAVRLTPAGPLAPPVPTALPAPAAVPAPEPVNGHEAGSPVSLFDRMFGATERPVPEEDEFAQVRHVEPAVRSGHAEPLPTTLPPIETVMPSRMPDRAPDNGLIEDVSWAAPVAVTPAAPPAPEPVPRPRPQPAPEPVDDSHGDLMTTVHRPRRPTAPAETGTGPMVSAVRCVNGHLNPTTSATCRICTAAVPVQAPVLVSRPTLGVLRLSNGEVIQLDRGVILGRAPGIPEGNDRDRPHHFKLPSPDQDISRKHVEVRLDGWQVVVVDLNSRNGTVVTSPGGVPEQLPAGGSRVLDPGAAVSLTDTVSFRFEVAG